MKRIGNIWDDTVNIENALFAIEDGTKEKRGDRNVQWLLYDEEAVNEDATRWHRIDRQKAMPYAKQLCDALKDRAWTHQPPRHKRQFCRNRTANGGKWRELYIPALDDHIISHMVMQTSKKAFVRGMHPHCCGSVPGRGIKHITRFVESWMRHDKQCRYFVKLDIHHFFDSIDRDKLKAILRSKIKDDGALWVFDQIIDSAPVACPIGYYTSPWLANLYLEDLDWYIEQQLYKERRGKRIKYATHMLRYVDDILLIGTSKSDLRKAVNGIKGYLSGNYGLEIKPTWEIKTIGKHDVIDGKWQMKPGTYWCDIGGYKFCKDSTILRDGSFLETRRLAKRMYKAEYYTPHQAASINSRIGWARHCDSNRFIENDIKPYVNIKMTRRLVSDVDKSRKRRGKTPGK